MKSKLLFWISGIDGRFRELVKEWARAHDINESKSGFLSSYCLSLLIIFHFQTCIPAILPPLKELYPADMAHDLSGVRTDAEKQLEETCSVNIHMFRLKTSGQRNRSSLSDLICSFHSLIRDTKQANLRSRCSPKGIEKLMALIEKNDKEMESDVLMRAVYQTGFGSLKELPPVKMEHAYIKKLLDNFDVSTRSIFGVKIEEKDVVNILGVPNGTEIVPRSTSREERLRLKEKFGKQTLLQLADSLKKLKEPDMHFKETFFLLAFANFYCPSTKDEPVKDLYIASEILPSAQNYNWAKFILDFLVEAIEAYQKRTSTAGGRHVGMAGCTYFLKVFALQNFRPLSVKSGRPLMSVWIQKEMKIAVKDHMEALENLVKTHETGDEAHAEPHNTRIEARSGPSDPSVVARLDELEKTVHMLKEAVLFSQPSFKVVHADVSCDNSDVSYKFLKSLEAKCPIHADVLYYYVRYLKRTMSSKAFARSLVLDTFLFKIG